MDNSYLDTISKMTNKELAEETKDKIWSSTFHVRQNDESHTQLDICYEEWIKRDGNASNYQKLHSDVKKEYCY